MSLPGIVCMLDISAARPQASRARAAALPRALPLLQEQEDVLTKLREFWNISNQTHSVRRDGAGAAAAAAVVAAPPHPRQPLAFRSAHLLTAPPSMSLKSAEHHSGNAERS